MAYDTHSEGYNASPVPKHRQQTLRVAPGYNFVYFERFILQTEGAPAWAPFVPANGHAVVDFVDQVNMPNVQVSRAESAT